MMSDESSLALIPRIQTVLAEALQVPADLVTPELAMGDLPQWDSMGHMEVMMLLEQHFGVEINNDTIANLTSVPAIYSAIVSGENIIEGRHD
jgi:acyl carrier protein